MMPIAGDHHLNMMMYFDDDLFKESVRLRMLNQEATFRNQVLELHRLYETQMMRTKNLHLKGVRTQEFMNCTSQGTFQRHLDANVSASVCGNLFDQHFRNKRVGSGTRENPVLVENFFPVDTESSLDDLELSLSIGGGPKQKRWQRKIFHQTVTSASSHEIIDLEESSCTELSGDINPIFELGWIGGSADPKDLHAHRSNFFSANCENKHVARAVRKSLSFVDECKTHLKQNLNEGKELSNASVVATLQSGHCMLMTRKEMEELPDVAILPVAKEFTSHDALCLDLNEALPDESFYYPKDQPVDYSGVGCSGVTDRTADDVHKGLAPDATSCSLLRNNCPDEVSAIIQPDTLNFEVMASNTRCTSSKSGKALTPGTESSSRPSDCCHLADSHHKHADQLGLNFTGRIDKGQRVAGTNDDILNNNTHLCCRTDPVGDLNSSPASCKSVIMTIDRSCSLKTMQSGIYLEQSDPSLVNSCPNSESSQNESSSQDESKSESFDEKKEVSAPDDFLVRRGAISLMYLSLESSRREQGCITKFDEVNENVNGKRDQPQHSIDTYESMVLKQLESNIEDYCVTSNPPEVIGMDKKDFGVKVRRGRRMKDFQKDILPSLASLSRHEISEDIRIMEAALRSREYKRLRSKNCEQKWFTPVKNKRSRLNYVCRKYYS